MPGLLDALLGRARTQAASMSARTLADVASSVVALGVSDPLLMVEMAAHFSAAATATTPGRKAGAPPPNGGEGAAASASTQPTARNGGRGAVAPSAGSALTPALLARALAAFADGGLRVRTSGGGSGGRGGLRMTTSVGARLEALVAAAAPRADLWALGVLARSAATIGLEAEQTPLSSTPTPPPGVAADEPAQPWSAERASAPRRSAGMWGALDARAVALLARGASPREVSMFAAALARAERGVRGRESLAPTTSSSSSSTSVASTPPNAALLPGPLGAELENDLLLWMGEGFTPASAAASGSASHDDTPFCEGAWSALQAAILAHAPAMAPLDLSHALWALVETGRAPSIIFDAVTDRMTGCLLSSAAHEKGADANTQSFGGRLETIAANTVRAYVISGAVTAQHVGMLSALSEAAARAMSEAPPSPTPVASPSTDHSALPTPPHRPMRLMDAAMLLDCTLRMAAAAAAEPAPTEGEQTSPSATSASSAASHTTVASAAATPLTARYRVAVATAACVVAAPEEELVGGGSRELRRLERGLSSCLLQWGAVWQPPPSPPQLDHVPISVDGEKQAQQHALISDALGRVQLVLETRFSPPVPRLPSTSSNRQFKQRREGGGAKGGRPLSGVGDNGSCGASRGARTEAATNRGLVNTFA